MLKVEANPLEVETNLDITRSGGIENEKKR